MSISGGLVILNSTSNQRISISGGTLSVPSSDTGTITATGGNTLQSVGAFGTGAALLASLTFSGGSLAINGLVARGRYPRFPL